MDNVTLIVTRICALAGVFVSFFAVFIAIWSNYRHGRKRNYLLRVAPKYSISPLFGLSRLTLLRQAQKPHI
jgi:hypothetical protein